MGDVAKDYNPPKVSSQTSDQLKALIKFGPKAAQTEQDIQESIAPQQQALLLSLLQQYAPQFSQVGTDIANQEAEAGIARDLSLATGSGKALADQAIAYDRAVNPEFYGMRETTAKGYSDLVGGQDPNKLTGAELSNIERGVNRLNARTGNLNTGDATSTVGNAMTFGDELGKKRDRFSSALNLFPGIATASRSPVDAFGVATGKTSATPNFGTQQYTAQNGANSTQGMMDRIQQTQLQMQDIKAGRRTPADFVNQGYNSAVGSSCCFIMIAANDGVKLPWWIIRNRDYFYNTQPRVRDGYRKMARRLVPLMERNLLIKNIIKYTMFYPLSFYGGYIQGLNKFGWMFKPIKNFWFNLWRNY